MIKSYTLQHLRGELSLHYVDSLFAIIQVVIEHCHDNYFTVCVKMPYLSTSEDTLARGGAL